MEQRSPLSGPHYDKCFQEQRLGLICNFKISLETNNFAKGIRDLYKFIAAIAAREVTLSP